MTSRELPSSEWSTLAGTDLGRMAPQLPPDARIVVVEDGPRMVACWAAIPVVHVEGAWIDPAYRKQPSVTIRLWREMRRVVRSWGRVKAITGACAEIQPLLEKHGEKVPFEEYVLCL